MPSTTPLCTSQGAKRILATATVVVAGLGAWPGTAAAEPLCAAPEPPPSCYVDLPQAYAATFVSQSAAPRSVIPGQAFEVTIRMRNDGELTWTPGAVRLGAQNPQDNLTWGLSRVDLTAPVDPGDIAVFAVRATAPHLLGVQGFQWQMLKEHVRWFGQQTPNHSVKVENHEWSLSDDMRFGGPTSAIGDRYDNPAVWSFKNALQSEPDPASYWPLNYTNSARANLPGLRCWQGDTNPEGLPIVCKNTRTDNPFPYGIDWAPGVVLMHPQLGWHAVAAWRSPYSGTVRVEGSVRDLHAACGDGIGWRISRATTRLASGTVANGGGGRPFSSGTGGGSLDAVTVQAGETIYLVVDPGDAWDHACDSTGVEFNLRQIA